VSELAETFKAGTAAPAGEDLWTSGPLTISFLDFIRKGAPAAREGEDDFFLLKLSALLQESGRVQVVERELLDKLLAELKLSATDLVNPDTALKLGRILSARVIATNTIMRYGSDVQVAVRLTDTETTALKGVVAESAKDLEKLTQTVAQKTAQKINAAYPIRGKVLSLEKEAVVLNIGSAAGVQKGMQFQVLKEIPSSKGRVRRRPAGTLTITSVEAQECWAAIPEGLKDLTEEMKVEQLIQER
jgi:hypothetical protein